MSINNNTEESANQIKNLVNKVKKLSEDVRYCALCIRRGLWVGILIEISPRPLVVCNLRTNWTRSSQY